MFVRIGASTTEFDKSVAKAANRLKSFGSQVSATGRSMTFAFTGPLLGAGIAAAKVASQMELAALSFSTLLGSAEKAGKFLDELKAFALKTPFQFMELQDAAKRMMAMGVAAHDVIPYLRGIGAATAALGGGKEMIDRITLALGQMRAKGMVQSQEMRQLAEAGIPAWEILARRLNTDVAGAMKMVENRQVDARMAVDMFVKDMTQRFGPAFEKYSETVAGRMEKAKESFTFALADMGKALEPFTKRVIDAFAGLADRFKGLAASMAAMTPEAQGILIGIVALAAAFPPLVWATGLFIEKGAVLIGVFGRLSGAIGVSRLALLGWLAAIPAAITLYKLFTAEIETAPQKFSKATQNISLLRIELHQLGVSTSALYDQWKRGTISWEEYASALRALKRHHEEAAVAIEQPKAAMERMMTLQELVAKSIKENLQQALKKSVDTIGEWLSASQPWGKRLELHAAQIDDLAFRVGLLDSQIDRWQAAFEKAGKMKIQMIEPDWSKVKGGVLETERLMQSIGKVSVGMSSVSVKSLVELRREADRLGSVYLRLVELQREHKATTIDVATAYEAWTQAEKKTLGLSTEHGHAAAKASSAWQEAGKEIASAMRHMARGIAEVIVQGGKMGEVFVGVAKAIAKAIIELIVLTAVKQLIKALSGVLDHLGLVGKALKDWAGVGAAIAKTAVPAAIPAAAAAAEHAGHAMGGIAPAGAGAAGAGGAAGAAGWVGAIGSVAGAVSGIIGNFQMRGMNKSLDLIEHETRYSQIHLLNLLERANEFWPALKDLWWYMWNAQFPALRSMDERLWAIAGAGGASVTINITEAGDARATAQQLVEIMKRYGIVPK